MADKGFVFTVDGKPLELNTEEITGRDAKDFRTQTGMAFRRAVSMFVESPNDVDLDTIAGIIWLARRQAGEVITYDTVLDEINYATKVVGAEAEVEPPEA